MTGLFIRLRMHHCLKVIEKSSDNNELGVCLGEDLTKLCKSPQNLKALQALASGDYISAPNLDNASIPSHIIPGNKLPMYFVERSEIWLNRIISFIAGILTAVAAHYIIQLLPFLFS